MEGGETVPVWEDDTSRTQEGGRKGGRKVPARGEGRINTVLLGRVILRAHDWCHIKVPLTK